MRGTIEKQQGSLAHERAQRAVRFACPKDRGVTLENLANRRGVTGENERRHSGHAQREPVAITARTIIEEPERIADKIEGRKKARPRWQLGPLQAWERGVGGG